MEVLLYHNDLTIQVFDDSAFVNSPDSPTSYKKVLLKKEDARYKPNSRHAIRVYRDNNVINSAIVLGSMGGTSVQKDTVLIDDGNLIIRCCNQLYSLSLPDLEVNWMVEPDWATCFSIYQYQDTYISHGEIFIARIDRTGKILWQFSAGDIFVCLYEGNPFEMFDDHIALTDFNGQQYKIDYNGHIIK